MGTSKSGTAKEGARWRDVRTRLWIAGGAGVLALLLLWLADRGPDTEGSTGGDAVGQRVERRSESGYELVSPSWDPDEVAVTEGTQPYLSSEELRLLNEARERWQNLDVAIQGR